MSDLATTQEIQKRIEELRSLASEPGRYIATIGDVQVLLAEIDRLRRIWEHNSAASVENERRVRGELDRAVLLLRMAERVSMDEDET